MCCRAGGEHADEPNLEFIAPSKVYTVVGGVTTVLDIMQLPALTPRQISLLAKHGPNGEYAGALLLLLLLLPTLRLDSTRAVQLQLFLRSLKHNLDLKPCQIAFKVWCWLCKAG
jgi:hypothetical protein